MEKSTPTQNNETSQKSTGLRHPTGHPCPPSSYLLRPLQHGALSGRFFSSSATRTQTAEAGSAGMGPPWKNRPRHKTTRPRKNQPACAIPRGIPVLHPPTFSDPSNTGHSRADFFPHRQPVPKRLRQGRPAWGRHGKIDPDTKQRDLAKINRLAPSHGASLSSILLPSQTPPTRGTLGPIFFLIGNPYPNG